MESFFVASKVVLPLLLLMVLGIVLRKTKLLDTQMTKKINALIFKVFLPALIFYNVYKSDLSEVFDGRLISFAVACIVIEFLALLLVVPLAEKDNRKRGVLIQGIFRSNFVIFGVPLSVSLLGGAVSGKVAVAVAFVIPVYNFLAVLSLEIFRNGKPDFGKIVKGIVTNPLILASVLGVLTVLSGIRLPSVLETTVNDVAKIATPLALIVLGASLNFELLKANSLSVFLAAACRLLVVPALCLGAAVLLGFRGAELAILISVFASPTAVSSYSMAQQMGGDEELAGQIVAVSTAFCIFTVFGFVFALHLLSLI